MSDDRKKTRVLCDLADCAYYLKVDGEVFCTHADKEFHLRVNPCPLYRLDWRKRGAARQ